MMTSHQVIIRSVPSSSAHHAQAMAATESEAPRPQQFPQDLTLSVGSVQGRIKVYVRPRPFDDATLEARGGNAVSIGGLESDEVTVVDDKGRESTFGFDHVFNTSASNGAVFEAVGRPVVKSVLCGYNGTLMAYGQTGTGKTHTLGADDGLIAQMFNCEPWPPFRLPCGGCSRLRHPYLRMVDLFSPKYRRTVDLFPPAYLRPHGRSLLPSLPPHVHIP